MKKSDPYKKKIFCLQKLSFNYQDHRKIVLNMREPRLHCSLKLSLKNLLENEPSENSLEGSLWKESGQARRWGAESPYMAPLAPALQKGPSPTRQYQRLESWESSENSFHVMALPSTHFVAVSEWVNPSSFGFTTYKVWITK